MENTKVIMKCCICGRVKTDDGWEYQFCEQNENLCSHGFCTACYELEVKKIGMAYSAVVATKAGQAALSVMAPYQ